MENGQYGQMDINAILAQVDALYEADKGEEAEQLMLRSLEEAAGKREDGVRLQLLNELLGYYRETSQCEMVLRTASEAIRQAKEMGLEGTIPYATTLLNIATAYRACGRLQESAGYYGQVQAIYDSQLEPDSMLVAGLKNNIALLYQEMGDFAQAKAKLSEALGIVEAKGAAYEAGVTCANLAGTCMQLEEREEAYQYALKAVDIFRRENVTDSHYAAALATLGAYFYHRRDYGKAVRYYRQGMDAVERNLGRNEYFRRLQANAAVCEEALAKEAGTAAEGQAGDVKVSARGDGAAGRQEEMEGREVGFGDNAEEVAGSAAGAADSAEEAAGGAEASAVASKASAVGLKESGLVEEEKARKAESCTGLALARKYYESFGRQMIEEDFSEYADKIAVGLVGRGSDCFGYDDEASRDHDWGPDFCMWVTDETYEEIGEALQQAYERLPGEFEGCRRGAHVNGRNRRGVIRISDFYRGLVEADSYEAIDWASVSDASLAAAVNGEEFRDEEGVFTAFRNRLKQGYPERMRYLKLAESAARFAQSAQYNYLRMLHRGDGLTACMMAWDGIKEAMKLQHYIEGKYPPHDKWLRRSLLESREGREVGRLLEEIAGCLGCGAVLAVAADSAAGISSVKENEEGAAAYIEQLGAYFARELYSAGFISDTDSYLDAHSEELVYKGALAMKAKEELVEDIAKLEFEAFDKVKNEGGRASCQNDWGTFSIMRKSQYLTWDRCMLLQYLYDFHREYHRGHNLIEEKYGRMMESTAPEKYAEIKSHFPELSPEKKAIIEQIVGLQVGWMEAFSQEYPELAGNARSIHTAEDDADNTSYETYLRGELGTYSDKMLELYGRYVVGYARAGRNLAYDIMELNVKMYGYESVEDAESRLKRAN